MQFAFGAGVLIGTRQDVTNSTPIQFGALQEGSIEFSSSTKQAYGTYQFPLAVARGTGKITGKAKMASVNGKIFSDLYFGLSSSAITTGQLLESFNEGPTAIPATPFTVTAANGATFVDDLGVVYGPLCSDGTACSLAGQRLNKVASGVTAGNYSVSAAGVYTFCSADNVSKYMVQISYTYTTSTLGQILKIPNPVLGIQPVFQAVLNVPYTASSGVTNLLIKLNACVSSKFTFATKLEDFLMPEFDFDAFADSSGTLATISYVNS